ncbi:MAG: hypothetical protein PHX30_03960 [Candidatus Pacebacteria bacterium]|jgi:hypothetical protein|nr:hypothetical protein [Candidatus Paceibacterota bacterium]
MVISKKSIGLSILAGILMGWASFQGIYRAGAYSNETLNWAAQAMAQDYVSLYLACPALLISAYLAYKGSFKAYLVWLGTLIYVIYSYALYSFAIHFGPNFLVYVAVLGFSFYAAVGSLMDLSWHNLADSFVRVKTKYPAILLFAIGFMFYFLWLSDIFAALSDNSLPADLAETGLIVNPVHVLDMAFILPGAIFTALALRRRKTIGYLSAVPFMVFFAIMGIAILSIFRVTAQSGFSVAAPQVIIMTVIVILSLAASLRFLGGVKDKDN